MVRPDIFERQGGDRLRHGLAETRVACRQQAECQRVVRLIPRTLDLPFQEFRCLLLHGLEVRQETFREFRSGKHGLIRRGARGALQIE